MSIAVSSERTSPRHVAIIMDGNRRWARLHGRSLEAAYRGGVDALRAAVRAAAACGVEVLTVYGFSTENWRRGEREVSLLMQTLAAAAQSELFGLLRERVRVRIIGDVAAFPAPARLALAQLVRATRKNSGLTLQLALNYSGRAEIVRAVRSIAGDIRAGSLHPADVDETLVGSRMYAPEARDPDLLVRTGGDLRISNFLLYQLAYTEIYTTPVLWPDFDQACFAQALTDYDRRVRRYGA